MSMFRRQCAYDFLTKNGEPSTIQKAICNPDASLWMTTIRKVIEALHKTRLGNLSHYRKEEKPSKTYGITRSRESNDQVERHRVRLVVKRYALKEGIDFNEIFSLVV